MPTFGPRNSLDQRRAQARASRHRSRREVGVEIKQFYLTDLDIVPVNFVATPTTNIAIFCAGAQLTWKRTHQHPSGEGRAQIC
jgi:hypothetical protein